MSPGKILVLVRPRADTVTRTLHSFAETVKQRFETNGWQVLDLEQGDAVRPGVEQALQDSSSVFIFYGHGLPDCILGQDNAPVIGLDNLDLLQDQRVYVVACYTAERLGRQAENIVRCYLGYNHLLWIWSNPLYAERLQACINKGILDMVDEPGLTAQQARQRIMDEYSRWIDYFSVGEGATSPRSTEFAADLVHNRDALRVLGDVSATLND